MKKIQTSFGILAMAVAYSFAGVSHANEYVWNVLGGGTQSWQANNWQPAGFPNDSLAFANLAVPLTNNLTVSTGSSNVTVAAIELGGTGSPVTTNITGTGRIVFNNTNFKPDFDSDRAVDGHDFLTWQRNFGASGANVTNAMGDANFDNSINETDLNIWKAAYGATVFTNPLPFGTIQISSTGTVGSTNIISAPLTIGPRAVEFNAKSTNDLSITGDIRITGGNDQEGNSARLRSFMPDGTKVTIGDFSLYDPASNLNRHLYVNDSTANQGTIHFAGVISSNPAAATNPAGNRSLRIGSLSGGAQIPLSTVILSGANTFSSQFDNGRANIVLDNNDALGTGLVKQSGPSNQVGYNFISTSDSRVIQNDMAFAQWQTIKGEHSLEWAGRVYQDNARGWINLLPAGKTFTLSGGQFPNETQEDPPAPGRILTFDGTGTTLVTGGLFDELDKDTGQINPGNFSGSFRKRGSGLVEVSGEVGSYSGETTVSGGNLRFATNAHFSNTPSIHVSFGAVGVATGVASNSTFLSRITSGSTGGLMLAAGEASTALNFNTFPLSSASNMTVAAPETGMTYTGTITPSSSHNTYRLGGGAGTLTLPNTNQLTGANGLFVSNGGEVRITGTNNYTGTTQVIAKYTNTLERQAAVDSVGGASGHIYTGTTLAVSNLGNGGSSSSLGSSSSDAANILIRGSTLKYIGAATSTNRLFTIGTGGATIDASGSGAINFTNAGALGMEVAPPRQGQTDGFSGTRDQVTHLPSTADLVVGMPVSGLTSPSTSFGNFAIPSGAVITEIISNTAVRISQPVRIDTFASGGTLTIGNYLRTLNLTGTNSGNNTLSSLVADSPQGPVGITKTGTGKWVLTNSSNAYSGPTRVEQGILSLSAPFLSNTSAVYLSSGATLDLNFAGIDTIGALYINGAPQPLGTWGGPGSGATNISNLFSGMGRLSVSVMGSFQAVPEPGSLFLAVGSLLAFMSGGRRIRRS